MRKLVTVRRISILLPIPNKDYIEQAIIDGWSLIVKKHEFKVGDLCVFHEIDSFLPEVPEYDFLEKPITYQGKVGYRLKTMKMSGVLSQGLALPITHFSQLIGDIQEGSDVTDLLGVVKYDNQQCISSTSQPQNINQEKFPAFIPKTDQERIQNLTHYFHSFRDMEFEETLKLDGSSMTCFKILTPPPWWKRALAYFGYTFNSEYFGVCSRNLEIKPEDTYEKTFNNAGKISTYSQFAFWKAAMSHAIKDKIPIGFAIQGELVGPNIQSNHEKVQDLEFYVFDVFNITLQKYLTPAERKEFCAANKIKHVPIVNDAITIFQECTDVQMLLQRVEGISMNAGTISEGRVYKSTTNPALTFKAISNRYLLKCEN